MKDSIKQMKRIVGAWLQEAGSAHASGCPGEPAGCRLQLEWDIGQQGDGIEKTDSICDHHGSREALASREAVIGMNFESINSAALL